MFSTIRTVATSEEAESVISLLRARGFHPLDPDLSAHFSVSACATSYPIVVPREEEAAVASLLREQATSERTRSPKPQGGSVVPAHAGAGGVPMLPMRWGHGGGVLLLASDPRRPAIDGLGEQGQGVLAPSRALASKSR